MFSSVQFSCSVMSDSFDSMNCSTPGLPVHHHLPEFTQTYKFGIQSVMPSSHLILCRPLFLLSPIPPSIRVFSNKSTLQIRWPKYWSLSFSIIPSKEHPGLISFRMDWFGLLAVQETLKSSPTPQVKNPGFLAYFLWDLGQVSLYPYDLMSTSVKCG